MDQLKQCKECKQFFNEIEFPIWSKKNNQRVCRCKKCHALKRQKHYYATHSIRRNQAKNSYIKHKEKRKKEVKDYTKNNPDKIKKWSTKGRLKRQNDFAEWKKTLKCSNCSENHVACLEFHHLDPSKKTGLISKLKNMKNRLQIELTKCIVLCSNCHRKHHYEENNNNQTYVQNQKNTTDQTSSKESFYPEIFCYEI